MGWQWVLPTARGDESWRLGRRVLDRGLRPAASASYRPMIQARTRVLLSRILEKPHEWESHIELSVSDPHYAPR
jgi:cytochrome P450